MSAKVIITSPKSSVKVKSLKTEIKVGTPTARYVIDPYITAEETEDGVLFTVETQGQTTTGIAYNGKDGARGDKGDKGDKGDTGQDGADGQPGAQGQPGQDGYSPTANVSKSGKTTTISITDKNGTTTATVKDGVTDYNDLDNKPDIPTALSDLDNDEGFITEEDIPAAPVQSVNGQTGAVNLTNLVQDLGVIDGEAYDWDIEEYLNTLQETGSYKFLWDEFKYFVDIKAVEVDGVITAQQIFWGTEEGPVTTAYRNLVIEGGEIVSADTITYLTFQEANSAFSRNTHVHVRFATQSQPIWDYCNTVAMQNANPFVIYFDLSTNKTYLIETFVGNRQPVYKLQKVTEMNDTSCFYQRSSYYYGGQEHWGSWYKFSGEVYTPNT